jgi:pyruvate kinase
LIDTETSSLKIRRTKIIATLGPASSEPEQIRSLVNAGVNIFRQNFSHGDHSYHKETYARIRKVAKELNKTIGILADLCGPKIRTGKFKNDKVELNSNQSVVVTTRDIVGTSDLIPSQYSKLAKDVEIGDRILLADGALELKVDKVDDTEIKCTVIYGGVLSNHKGINLPGVSVSAPSLTEKDKADAKLALELGVDFLALSFVRSAADILDLKKLINKNSANTQIIAKIEKPEALDNAEEILDVADGIMIARGDLGVELNPEQVPVAQHQLIDLARKKFKPVIVATQMLESMIDNARPTRAEVTDVAYAVTLGTDAIMLSGETAVGAFPVEAVKMMDRIARQTEGYLWKNNAYGTKIRSDPSETAIPIWDAIANSMSQLTHDLRVRAVVVISKSGMSAATMSSARPAAPIIAITKTMDVCQKVLIYWGIVPVLSNDTEEINFSKLARNVVLEKELASIGEKVLLVQGFQSDNALNNPSVTVLTI